MGQIKSSKWCDRKREVINNFVTCDKINCNYFLMWAFMQYEKLCKTVFGGSRLVEPKVWDLSEVQLVQNDIFILGCEINGAHQMTEDDQLIIYGYGWC